MNDDIELLRFATAGSVDDGKSTLIGRLLYDSKTVMSDQLAAVERVSVERGDEHTDLALLTDGLRSEREQGITIDVAYRYFATPRRKFIIADTPGHIQYTRNMVTGASTADLSRPKAMTTGLRASAPGLARAFPAARTSGDLQPQGLDAGHPPQVSPRSIFRSTSTSTCPAITAGAPRWPPSRRCWGWAPPTSPLPTKISQARLGSSLSQPYTH